VSDDPSATRTTRRLGPAARALESTLLVTLTILGALWGLELQHFLGLAIFNEQYLGLVFALAMAAVFIGVPARKGEDRGGVPWHDWIAAALAVACGLYVTVHYPEIATTLGSIEPERWVLGLVVIGLVIEATRRCAGWSLVAIALVFLAYALSSHLFPGALNMPSPRWQRLAAYLYLDSNALFGTPLDVTASVIVPFILFGRVLYAVGGDRFLTDFALALMGRYRGGPAKVSVVASSLFGTTSGSAVSNVVMDGPITIPMMKRTGYPAHLAAGIEAVASTGGQIMPPVMGITAFLIAEYLSISYGAVVIAAVLPAILYYVAVFAQVDLEAAKRGLGGIDAARLPRLAAVMRNGWVFIVPVSVLLVALIELGWRPGKAGMAAVFATLAVALLRADTRPSAARLVEAMREAGRTTLDLVVITAIAGLVIGTLQISGLSFNFSVLLLSAAAGELLLLLVLTALACIVLGMGLPTGVIYVLLAVLVAPALTQLGVAPIAAHLFLFYFGMMSMITPPICLATYAAAAIARADFWRTGWTGMRLGVVAYIVPFAFVCQPALLFEGTAIEVALAFASAAIGVIVLCMGLVGYARAPLGAVGRAVFVAAGMLLFFAPAEGWLGLGLHALGLAVAGAAYALQRPRAARSGTPA